MTCIVLLNVLIYICLSIFSSFFISIINFFIMLSRSHYPGRKIDMLSGHISYPGHGFRILTLRIIFILIYFLFYYLIFYFLLLN